MKLLKIDFLQVCLWKAPQYVNDQCLSQNNVQFEVDFMCSIMSISRLKVKVLGE